MLSNCHNKLLLVSFRLDNITINDLNNNFKQMVVNKKITQKQSNQKCKNFRILMRRD
jgi:hypothetical protein